MSAKYILEVQADPSGLSALGAEFKKLDATIQATARTASAALAGMGKNGASELAKMRGDLDQALAGLRTLQAENEKLTKAMESGATRRGRAAKDAQKEEQAAADAHVRSWTRATSETAKLQDAAAAEDRRRTAKRLQDAEKGGYDYQAVVRRSFESEVRGARKAYEEIQAIQAKRFLDAQKQTEREMNSHARAVDAQIRQSRQEANEYVAAVDRKIAANRRLHAEEQRGTSGLLNASIGLGARSYAQEQADGWALLNRQFDINARAAREAAKAQADLGKAKDGTTSAARRQAEAFDQLHSAARGAAGGLGLLWTTYGASTALLVGAFALSAGVKESIKDFSEWQYQMTFVGALTRKEGESMGEAMKRMGAISSEALKLMQNSLFAPKEGAEALRQLAQAGLTAEQSLAALPAVLDLATVGEMKVADAAFSAVAIMHSFNKETKDLTQIVDQLSKAASISTTSVTSITESVKQASVVGEQYNVTLEDTLVGLTLLADRGIRGTAAGTAFRNMIVELYSPTDRAAAALKKLGVNTFDAEGKIRPMNQVLTDLRKGMEQFDKQSQLALLGELANERSRKALSAYLDELHRVPEVWENIATKSKGFAKQTADALEDLTVKGQWKQAMSSLEASFIRMGDAANGPLYEAVKRLKEIFQSKEWQEGMGKVVSGVADLAAFAANNGGKIVTFIEGLLAYKAGKFLWPLAAAGLASVVGGIAPLEGLASKWQSKGGLIAVALFGGWEAGTWLSKFDLVREAAIHAFGPLFEAIRVTNAFFDRFSSAAPSGGTPGVFSMDGMSTPDMHADPNYTLPSVEDARREMRRREAAGYMRPLTASEFRRREIGDAGGLRTVGGMATGTEKYVSAKDLKEAAQAELQALLAHYQSMDAAAKGHYDAQMTILRAYRDAQLITEEEYDKRSTTVTGAYQLQELERETAKINKLQELRKKFSDSEKDRVKIDAELEKTLVDAALRRSKIEVAAVQDAAKAWKEYNNAGKNVLQDAREKNDTLAAEVAQLKEGTVQRKDATLATLANRIALEEETLARLENTTAGLDETQMVTTKMLVDAAEIRVIKERLELLKKERDRRKGLLQEREELENSWLIGAKRGLDAYVDHSLSTAKIMETGFKKAFQSLEDTIFNFVKTGKLNIKDMLKSVGDDILRMLIKLNITQPIAQWLSGGLSGWFGGGGNQLQGPMPNGGNLSSGVSMLGTAGTFAANWASGGFGTAVGQTGLAQFYGGMTGAIQGPGLTGAAGMGSSFGATMGGSYAGLSATGWGIIIAAVIAIGMWASKYHTGGEKVEGSFVQRYNAAGEAQGAYRVSDEYGNSFLSGTQLNDQLTDPGNKFSTSYQAAVRSLGGSALNDYGFGIGVSHDPRGNAPSRLFSDVSVNGRSVFNRARDMDDKEVPQEMGVEALRMLVAALRETDFADEIDKIFDNIDPMTASVEDLNAALAAAAEMRMVLQGLDELNFGNLNVESLRAMAKEGETIGQTFQRVAGQLQAFDASFTSEARKLETANNAVTEAFKKMGIAIPGSKDAFYDLVHGLDLTTERGRELFDALMAVAPAFDTVAAAAAGLLGEFDSFMSQNRPGYGAAMDQTSLNGAAAQFIAKNPWAAGMSTSQLVAALRTITREDFQAYLAKDPTLARLILTILGLDQTMTGTNALIEAVAGPSASTIFDGDLTNANVRPGPAYEWNGRQWVNTDTRGSGSGGGGLNDYLDGLLMGDLSTLDPKEKFAEAKKKYESTLALAKTGDQGAVDSLRGASDTYLQLARDMYASSPAYVTLFRNVFDEVAGVAGAADFNTRMMKEAEVQSGYLNQMVQTALRTEQLLQSIYDGAERNATTVATAVEEGTSRIATTDPVPVGSR